VLTLHRASNVDDPATLAEIANTVAEASARLPVIFPVHPRTVNRLETTAIAVSLRSAPGLIFAEPLGYLDFLCLLSGARLVFTDSGGIQAETTMLGVPCLTLRWNTEWPETVSEGTNHLVGTERAAVIEAFDEVMVSKEGSAKRPEGWDGHAAARVADVLLHCL
jgi:UDP-N-acetylglucosamine 2-epimerase (non-hydrolysing)